MLGSEKLGDLIDRALDARRRGADVRSVLSHLLPALGERPRPRVIIAGCGFSGLAAMHELKQLGFPVHGFEARKRLGGRVRTSRSLLEGCPVEEGGEFIGEAHTAWRFYADVFGLRFNRLVDYRGPFSPLIADGSVLTEDDALSLFNETVSIADAVNDLARTVTNDAAWETPDAAALDATSLADWLGTLPVTPEARRALEMQIEANQGVGCDRISLLGFLALVRAHGVERYWTETENYRCAGGATELATSFAAGLPGCIEVDAPIRRIKTGGNGVVIRTADGREHRAGHAVLAAPPTVWSRIEIVPEIPTELWPSMGVNVKLFAVVKRGIQLQPGLSGVAMYRGGNHQLCWEASEGLGTEHAVLTCFSGGRAAARLSTLAPEQREEAALAELEQLYLGITRNVCAIGFKNWPRSGFTLGGYSVPAPGDVTMKWRSLREGFGRLHLAGEPFDDHWSFMEGALRRGIEVARTIAHSCL